MSSERPIGFGTSETGGWIRGSHAGFGSSDQGSDRPSQGAGHVEGMQGSDRPKWVRTVRSVLDRIFRSGSDRPNIGYK